MDGTSFQKNQLTFLLHNTSVAFVHVTTNKRANMNIIIYSNGKIQGLYTLTRHLLGYSAAT